MRFSSECWFITYITEIQVCTNTIREQILSSRVYIEGSSCSAMYICIGSYQYLNCKTLHVGRFCSLDQTDLACESTLVKIT